MSITALRELLDAGRRWVSSPFEPQGGLALQEFTAILSPSSDEAAEKLQQVLAAQDEALADEYRAASAAGQSTIPSYAVPGLHGLRWVFFAPTERNEEGPAMAVRSRALILSIVFDGDVQDVLAGVFAQMGSQLEQVLQHCHGFVGCADPKQFVMNARAPSGYFFRDAGPLAADDKHLLDATRTEIDEALELRKRFEAFYAENRFSDAEPLRAAFAAFCRESKVGFPLPLTRFERPVPDEQRWIRRVVELTLRLQERHSRVDKERRRRRVAHTKHHGFLKAIFKIENLPERYRRGIFQKPGTEFSALLRTSNTWETRQSDDVRDGRGLSIKVLNVGEFGDPVLGRASAEPVSQDFLLISDPVFFARDIRDFTILRSIIDVGTRTERVLRGLGFFSRRRKEAWILLRTLSKRIGHPFELEYHSVTPYLLGEDDPLAVEAEQDRAHVVKYVVKARHPAKFSCYRPNRQDGDYLSATLRQSLEHGPVELEFFLNIHHGPNPPPVEDATVDWDRGAGSLVRAATITITDQEPATPDRLEWGEVTEFNPWHALAAHRPLGSLNRGRLAIYLASAAARQLPRPALAKVQSPNAA